MISVVIVNYNAGGELLVCVRSVAASTAEVEIIVVDNASSDGSLEQLEGQYDGKAPLLVLRNTKNLGFAVACNQGSARAQGEYLFYLNPDCLLQEETIQVLLETVLARPEVGMAGGLICNHDGSEQRGCRRKIPTPWTALVNSFGLRFLARFNTKLFADFRLDGKLLSSEPLAVEAISGACMLVSRKAFVDVGPMDEEYFLHCEDLDWCLRFGQRGWTILFVPQARLVHAKGSCSASRPFFVEWSKHKGMARFYKKFYSGQYPRPMLWLVWCGIWFRFGVTLIQIMIGKILGFRRHEG